MKNRPTARCVVCGAVSGDVESPRGRVSRCCYPPSDGREKRRIPWEDRARERKSDTLDLATATCGLDEAVARLCDARPVQWRALVSGTREGAVPGNGRIVLKRPKLVMGSNVVRKRLKSTRWRAMADYGLPLASGLTGARRASLAGPHALRVGHAASLPNECRESASTLR